MDTHQHPDLVRLLPRDVRYQITHTLRGTMPPASDAPDDEARRDDAAIALAASLRPADVDEADIAAKYVAAGARAIECLRLANEQRATIAVTLQCTAQAAAMLRQAQALRRLLDRRQAERRSAETDAAATAPQAPEAAPAEIAPVPAPDIAAEADRYALAHRKRATLIRALGRLPDRLSCGPMSPALVQAIVTGNSPVLRALDRNARQVERIAA